MTQAMNDSERTGAYQPDGSDESASAVVALPQHIGRYRVEKILGQGGFGLVYLAHDGQLQRLVAIKGTHRHRVKTAADAEVYLTAAPPVTNLGHSHIRPR